MSDWFLIVVAICVAALTASTLPLLWSLYRAGRTTERLLLQMDQELPVLLRDLSFAAQDAREAAADLRQTGQHLRRAGDMAGVAAERLGGPLLAAGARLGQGAALATALMKAWKVFSEFRRNRRKEFASATTKESSHE